MAFIVHRENSPSRGPGIFYELVAEDLSVLTKHVAFDFPGDMNHAHKQIEAVGFRIELITDGNIKISYSSHKRASVNSEEQKSE